MDGYNTTSKINYIKSLTVGTAMSLALLVGCSSSKKADNTHIASNLDSMVTNFKTYETDFNTNFQKYVADGYLSEREQNMLYEKLKLLKQISINAEKLSENLGKRVQLMTKDDKKLSDLLDDNLTDMDIGTPELEKELRKRGYNVNVESVYSQYEKNFIPGQILLLVLGLMIIFSAAYGATSGRR